jgi:hypothetical protein
VTVRPSKTDVTPRHFNERYIPDWGVRLGFEDVGQIEKIIVSKACDGRFDLGKASGCATTAISEPLHSCLEHMCSYHKRPRACRGICRSVSAWVPPNGNVAYP